MRANNYKFEELYEQLYNQHFDELEKLRKKDKTRTVNFIKWAIVGILMISVILVYPKSFFIIFGVLIAWTIIANIVNLMRNKKMIKVEQEQQAFQPAREYDVMYKEKVLTPIIERILPESKYTYYEGINKEEYKKGSWATFNEYNSKEKLVVNINDKAKYTLAMVTSEHRSFRDGFTDFSGLAGFVKLTKKLDFYIKIMGNELYTFDMSKDKIQINESEFEKIFVVKSDNKIKAMQIFTTDVMTKIIDFVKENKILIDLYIKEDTLYTRFHINNIFETPILTESMEYDRLNKFKSTLEAIVDITEYIYNVINEIEM